MQQDLQLAGLSERTQEAYVRAVRQLAAHFQTPPDQITEQQLRDYFLFLKNDKQFAAASLKICSNAVSMPLPGRQTGLVYRRFELATPRGMLGARSSASR